MHKAINKSCYFVDKKCYFEMKITGNTARSRWISANHTSFYIYYPSLQNESFGPGEPKTARYSRYWKMICIRQAGVLSN